MSVDTTDNPNVKLHVTEEKNVLTPPKYIDTMRQSKTKIDSKQEILRTIRGQKMDKCTSPGAGLGHDISGPTLQTAERSQMGERANDKNPAHPEGLTRFGQVCWRNCLRSSKEE